MSAFTNLDASSESKPKKHWRTLSQFYRLGPGGKSWSGDTKNFRSRIEKWSVVMGRRSIMKSPRTDLEGGRQKVEAETERQKSSLRKHDAAESHLHIMIAPDAKVEKEPVPKLRKPAKKAVFNPYHHANKSHTHVLIASDEDGPDPFKEDMNKTSLQIMINPNAKENPNVAQQVERDPPTMTTIVTNPYANVNRPMGILISSDDPNQSRVDTTTTMTSLQVMINPNAKQEEIHPPQKSQTGLPDGYKIKSSPYHQANQPHTNVIISSDGAGPRHWQANTNMTSLQVMIDPHVKDDLNAAHQSASVSSNMKVLISNDGKWEESTNMSSLQRIMINPNVSEALIPSNDVKWAESSNLSSVQRIMINPNIRDEEPDLQKQSLEVLPAEEKIGSDSSSGANEQTAEVKQMIPPFSSENQGQEKPVEESPASLDSQSQADEQKASTSDGQAQTRTEADVLSNPVLENVKEKLERRASDAPKSKPEKEKNNKDLQATKALPGDQTKNQGQPSKMKRKLPRRATMA